jgi:type II secretory pathway pseudopilin PulG
LLEMMIAMAIVAIIVGLAASGIRAMTRSGAQSEVQRVLVVAIQAQDRHAAEHNVYAASAEALAGYGLDAHAGVQLTVQSASREDYCMEVVLASGAGATYSARPGEVVLEADCANRLIDAGGNVDGEPDPILATTPTAFDLGRVIVGTTATGVVTIRNDGGGWLTGSASIIAPTISRTRPTCGSSAPATTSPADAAIW